MGISLENGNLAIKLQHDSEHGRQLLNRVSWKDVREHITIMQDKTKQAAEEHHTKQWVGIKYSWDPKGSFKRESQNSYVRLGQRLIGKAEYTGPTGVNGLGPAEQPEQRWTLFVSLSDS